MRSATLCRAIMPAVLCSALAGCNGTATVSPTPPPAVSHVDRILMQTPLAAVNWDGRPGPDGLEARIYLFRRDDRGLPVTANGTLEFAVYEGVVGGQQLAEARPFYSWRFDGETLKRHLSRTTVGWAYQFRLGWGTDAPATSSVTLVSRYLPPEGMPIIHRPITIATRPR